MRVAGVTRAGMASTLAVSSVSGAATGVAPARQDGDLVNEKAMRGVDRLVARAEIGAGQQVQQLVGAGAADDAGRIEAVELGDRLAQGSGRAIGVTREVGRRGEIGLDGAPGMGRTASRWRRA